MRLFITPTGDALDLDQVLSVSALFVNKNDAKYNCYEIYLTNGRSFGVFDEALSRDEFITQWSAV